MCKVIKVVVSEDGQRREVVKANLTVSKAIALREKLDDSILKDDWSPTEPVVSYLVEGTV